jgi:hypothetical protein
MESGEWNAIGPQISQQSLPFVAIWVNSYVHCVAVVVAPAIVQR